MHKKVMTNEHKLVLLCTRLNLNNSNQQEIRKLLSGSIDWNKIIEISNRHEILFLLYYNLNKLSLQKNIPQDIYCIIKNSYYFNLLRNLRFYKELFSILELTNREQIEIILLKGISLIETIYDNPALRMMVDIDILVKESELIRFKNVLSQLGYREIVKNFSPSFIQKYRITFGFIKSISPNSPLYIDLHRALVPVRPHKISLPRLWERTQENSIEGQKIKFLSFEDTLLFLALHLRGNMRQPLPLKSICDIAELFNLYGTRLDWKYIQIVARKNRMVSDIYFAIYISKELFNASISDELMNKFKSGILKDKLIRLCMNRYNFLEAKIWQGFILRFLLFDKITDFLLYLWRVSFLERFIARGDFRKIFTTRVTKKCTHISADEITKK